MKSPGKKIKHKLQVSDDPVLIFLGLVTPEPDYKTSLLLNNALGTRFRSRQPLNRPVGEGELCSFSRFSSGLQFNDTTFELIQNRSNNCIIDKKFSGLDYLLIIKGSDLENARDEVVSRIRDIVEITAVFLLDDNIPVANSILQQINS